MRRWHGFALPGTIFFALLVPGLCRAAEQAAEAAGPLEIQRSGPELAVLLAGLALFWVVALGTAVVFWMRAREADRLHQLEGKREEFPSP